MQLETPGLRRSLLTAEETQKAAGWCPPQAAPPLPNHRYSWGDSQSTSWSLAVPRTHTRWDASKVRSSLRTVKLLMTGSKPVWHLCSREAGQVTPVSGCSKEHGETVTIPVHRGAPCTEPQCHSDRLFWSPSPVPGELLFFPLAGEVLMLPTPAALISSH